MKLQQQQPTSTQAAVLKGLPESAASAWRYTRQVGDSIAITTTLRRYPSAQLDSMAKLFQVSEEPLFTRAAVEKALCKGTVPYPATETGAALHVDSRTLNSALAMFAVQDPDAYAQLYQLVLGQVRTLEDECRACRRCGAGQMRESSYLYGAVGADEPVQMQCLHCDSCPATIETAQHMDINVARIESLYCTEAVA